MATMERRSRAEMGPPAEVVRMLPPDLPGEWGQRWNRIDRSDQRHVLPHHIRVGVYERDGKVCRMCGTDAGEMHLDHVIPWSAGGPDASWNLRVLCAPCNLRRSTRILVQDTRTTLPLLAWCLDCPEPVYRPRDLDDELVFGFCLQCLMPSAYADTVAVDVCPQRLWDRCMCLSAYGARRQAWQS